MSKSKACVLILVERKSGLIRIAKLPGATSEHTTQAIVSLLIGEVHPVRRITTENGSEFQAFNESSVGSGPRSTSPPLIMLGSAAPTLPPPARKSLLEGNLLAVTAAAAERVTRYEELLAAQVPQWRLYPAVQALMCFRGFQLVAAATRRCMTS
jgi:hypothetical protein